LLHNEPVSQHSMCMRPEKNLTPGRYGRNWISGVIWSWPLYSPYSFLLPFVVVRSGDGFAHRDMLLVLPTYERRAKDTTRNHYSRIIKWYCVNYINYLAWKKIVNG